MTSLLGPHSLAANGPFRTRNRAGARQMAKFARCSFAKTTANCFNSFCYFHFISSVSRPQRPLICDCIHFSFPEYPPPPSPVANIYEKIFLGALFIKKVPLETGAPPQLYDASYTPEGSIS